MESSSNYPSYDQQTLINELEYLDVSNMGNYFVLIYEFDDYKTIDLIHQDAVKILCGSYIKKK